MIERLENEAINFPFIRALLPDVEIYYNAVRYALIYDQFYQDWKPDEFEVAAMSLTTPGLILPDQRKIPGTRYPPSQVVPLPLLAEQQFPHEDQTSSTPHCRS
ncbi:MAG: hypothetical protein HOI15_14145 [Opitutales bacterium]|jgi:hypothetical protein|nr:hypothetical protein [Opitutales bacterium]MBT6767483.1 hypothetical protein [Opitutales bacterium]